LVAFCQVFDQDVTVHLPRIKNFDRDSISYTNEHRATETSVAPLHICYGGDEVTRAHYDSARSRDGSIPRTQNSPLLKPVDPRNTTTTLPSPSPGHILSNRALRNSRSDISSELIHDLIQNGKENSMERLNDIRARSPSVSSSQHSSSSKRSLDNDGEPIRSSKRADRRKTTRRRVDMTLTLSDADNELSPRHPVESPVSDASRSTQGTEPLSDEPLTVYDHKASIRTTSIILNDEHPNVGGTSRPSKPQIRSNRSSLDKVTKRLSAPESSSPRLMSVTERPKSTLRA
jgi:hypothetical protein